MIRLNVFVRVNESNREEAIKAAKELTACSLNFIKTSYNHQKNDYIYSGIKKQLFWTQLLIFFWLNISLTNHRLISFV